MGIGTPVWPGARAVVSASARGPRGHQHGKHASEFQTHFQQTPGITKSLDRQGCSTQVRTDKVLYNLQAHFGIVFLIQHLEASKDSSLTWKSQPVPKVSSQVPVKPQPLR